MARYSAGTQTGAGSTTLPIASLFSNGVATVRVVEIGVYNTTTTAVDLGLVRYGWAAVGTVGTGITPKSLDNPLMTANALCYTTPATGAPTFTSLGYRTELGAAAGSGNIWTFGGYGIELPAAAGTLNGIAIIPIIGTGQVCDVYFVFDE